MDISRYYLHHWGWGCVFIWNSCFTFAFEERRCQLNVKKSFAYLFLQSTFTLKYYDRVVFIRNLPSCGLQSFVNTDTYRYIQLYGYSYSTINLVHCLSIMCWKWKVMACTVPRLGVMDLAWVSHWLIIFCWSFESYILVANFFSTLHLDKDFPTVLVRLNCLTLREGTHPWAQ